MVGCAPIGLNPLIAPNPDPLHGGHIGGILIAGEAFDHQKIRELYENSVVYY